MKYIDADKLIAEIERLEHENCMNGGEHFCMRRAICLGNLRNIASPIYHEQQEQPEVFDTLAFQKGVQEGRRLEREDIRQEIERRHAYQKEMYNKTKPDGRPNDGWAESLAIMGELEELRTFLDSLSEEPVTDCRGLEEAAIQAHKDLEEGEGLSTLNIFKAGAEWKYQKDRYEFAKLKAKEWMSGYDDAISQFVKIPYEPRDWFSSKDGDFICGASFDETIPAKVELYYRTKLEENESKN